MESSSRSEDKNVEANRKKRLTPAEKRQLKLIRQENLKLQTLRDELIRETINTTKLIKEKGKRWRDMRKQFATPDLHDTVHTIWKSFEWACDSKDSLISELLKSLKISEQIAERQFTDTADEIDHLLNDFYAISDNIEEQEQKGMRVYKEKVEVAELRHEHENKLEYMKTVSFCNTRNTKESVHSVLGEFLAQKEEMTSINTSELELWLLKKTNRTITVWFQYKNATDNYRSNANRILKKTADLAIRVEKEEELIQNQKIQIDIMKSKVERMNEMVAKGGSLNDLTTLANLVVERTQLYNTLRALDKKFKVDKRNAENRIKDLVHYSNQAIAALEDVTAKGDKLIKLRSLCHKLETPEEQSRKRRAPKFRWLTRQQDHDLYSKMTNFWQDFHEVKSIYELLYARREYYKSKNKQLKKHLKNCLTNAFENVPNTILEEVDHKYVHKFFDAEDKLSLNSDYE